MEKQSKKYRSMDWKMLNKFYHLYYVVFSKVPDFNYIPMLSKRIKKLRAKVLNIQNNKSIGKNVMISKNVRIWASTTLEVGDETNIKENVIFGGIVRIGKCSEILGNTYIDGSGGVSIGDHTHIGRENHIYSHNHDVYQKNQKVINSKEIFSPVSIGDDVMLFSKVSIMAGVGVNTGCVIAHASVVTKDTEMYGIYAGVPAKKIGQRE